MLRTLVPILLLFMLIATGFPVFTVGSSAPNDRAVKLQPYGCGIEPLTDSPGWH